MANLQSGQFEKGHLLKINDVGITENTIVLFQLESSAGASTATPVVKFIKKIPTVGFEVTFSPPVVTPTSYSYCTLDSNDVLSINTEVSGGLKDEVGSILPTDFVGSPRKFTVILPVPALSTNFNVTVNAEDIRFWTIENKTINSFTINSNASTALTQSVFWQIIY